MKVTRYHRGYAVRLTEREMLILRMMEGMADKNALYAHLDASERKAFGRRAHGGNFLRTDKDNRK